MNNLNYPKGCGCVGACGHGVEGSGGTIVQNPAYIGDQVGSILIKNGGIETNYIYKDPFSLGMSGLLFDIGHETYADGTKALVYRLKAGLGGRNNMKSVAISQRNGCCVITRYEGTVLNTTTTPAAPITAGDATIELADATAIGGIATPMSLHFTDEVNGRRVTVTVVGVDAGNPNLLTLKEPAPADIDTSACVYRGHYNPAAGCTNSYDNNVSYYNNDKEYHSFFTRIIQTLKYNNKCMINQTYLSDLLYGDDGAKMKAAYMVLQTNFQQQINEALKQFIRSIFWHRNRCGDNQEFGETYGLLYQMQQIHNAGTPQFFDMSKCCDPAKCDAENAESLIKSFLKLVHSRTQLSIYSDKKKVMIAINNKMLETLMDLRKYFEMFTGEVRIINQTAANNGDVISTRRKTFVIEDRGYEISFVYEVALDEIPGEFGLLMPEDTMGVFTYKNDYVDVNGQGVTIVPNQQQLIAGDTLKFKIWKDERSNNMVDGCTDYTMWIEYAIVRLYVDKCAYAGITNFAICNADTDCHDCTIDPADVPFVD